MPMKLFISYSRDDKSFVYELARKLNEEAEHDVWIDRRLTGADLWWDTILNSIEASECFVMILTPRSVGSIYCRAELDYAHALGKPILPLLLKPCTPPHILDRIQYIDITNASLIETLLQSMNALHRLEMRLLRTGKTWTFPDPPPKRPDVPKAKPDEPGHIYETFVAAEEAYRSGRIDLAKDLYKSVIQADSEGMAKIAKERLAAIKHDASRHKAYDSIQRLFEQGAEEVAVNLLKEYQQSYGTKHDPEGYFERYMQQTPTPISQEQETIAPSVPLVAKFEPEPVSGNAPLEVTFHNQSEGNLIQILWDFNGDGVTDSISQSPTYTYPEAGEYNVTLTVLDDAGNSDVVDHTIIVDAHDGKPARPIKTAQPSQQFIAHPDYYAGRMVKIPAGKFFFGDWQEKYLDDFYIDIYPVTNQDYFQFMQATGASAPQTWRKGKFKPEESTHPVTGVTYEQALAFSQWVNKRLPTEEEWEKAARGVRGKLFPWGDHFDPHHCNFDESKIGKTTPVNQYVRSASPFGVYDMVGNVWEWTQTVVRARGIGRENNQVLKGGSFRSVRQSLQIPNSTSLGLRSHRKDVGFRCVWSPVDE